MTVNKNDIFIDTHTVLNQRGASVIEVLLSIAIVAIMSPFVYNQISESTRNIRDIALARDIIELRNPALNFVRLNQDKWPDTAQIRLDDDEMAEITEYARSGFIDKYSVRGAIVTDVYLAFNLGGDALRAAKVAKNIGDDAAVVTEDGIAYGAFWAVTAPDFSPGDLVYRINHNFGGDDNSKYLHRGTSGEDNFNVMQRTLNMGRFNVLHVGTVSGESAKISEASTSFVESNEATAMSAYFTQGAVMDGSVSKIGLLRVTGDMIGFRMINTRRLNDSGFSNNGSIITDRATIKNSVNVGRNLTLKADSARTITGFSGIVAHSLAVPFLLVGELDFHNNFGITVSGELLMAATSPLKIGSWMYPAANPPRLSRLVLSRANIPAQPNSKEFDKIIGKEWQSLSRQP